MVPNGIVGTPSQPPNETPQPVGIRIVDDRSGVNAVSDLMAKIQCLIKNALCLAEVQFRHPQKVRTFHRHSALGNVDISD